MEVPPTVAAPRLATDDCVPPHYTVDMARRDRDALRALAHKWLTELLNRYVRLPHESRGHVGEAISAVASTAGEAVTASFYKEALAKVVSSLQAIKVCPSRDSCSHARALLLVAKQTILPGRSRSITARRQFQIDTFADKWLCNIVARFIKTQMSLCRWGAPMCLPMYLGCHGGLSGAGGGAARRARSRQP
jgi:hypothetical protein